MKKYVVQEGDTMWSISEATGVKPNLLLASNPQVRNPNQLRPGTIIVVPELKKSTLPPLNAHHAGQQTESPTASLPAEAAAAPALPPEPSVAWEGHTPAPGTAAAAAGTPPTKKVAGEVQSASKTSGKIPSFFGFVWPHVVQPGETWESIQSKYSVTPAHLEQLNPSLRSRSVRPGEVVYVPGMIPDALLVQLGNVMPQMPYGQSQMPYGQSQMPYGQSQLPYGQPQMPYGQQAGVSPAYGGATQMPAAAAPEVGTSLYPEMGPHEHNPYRGTDFDSDTFAWPKQGSSSISVYLGESSAHLDT